MVSKDRKRNAFVALCDYATHSRWCWKIHCTTCGGHAEFRIAFSKIIRDQHPDNKSFWPNDKDRRLFIGDQNKYDDFFGKTSEASQKKLASIVAEAKIIDIKEVAVFPDWLGCIGLVVHHCSNRDARKKISDSLIPQFVSVFKDNEVLSKYFEEKYSQKSFLELKDLDKIESSLPDPWVAHLYRHRR